MGVVSHTDVADMHAQLARREARLVAAGAAAAQKAACGLVAVVAGAGMRVLYESLGVSVLDGGLTLNPSTYELLAAIHAVRADEVVVLPNSPNVIMAAERAAELSEKTVRVVPSKAQQAGLAVAVSFMPDVSAEKNAQAMSDALGLLRLGGVAPAARDDGAGRFCAGEAVGFVADEIVAWGEAQTTLAAVLVAICDGAEIVTCIAGDGAPLSAEIVALLVPDGVELEHSIGGQPAWWYLLAAE
jgi:dihydroxyacetone kinase-like predicted kinase